MKAREQNLDYVAGKKALEDHIEAFDMLDKRGRLTRQNVTSDIKTGAGNMRVESKSGATCFVATAAYGDGDHPNVRFLRSFRDGWLQRRKSGRAFIDWYWRVGPKLAEVVGSREPLRLASRVALGFWCASFAFAGKTPLAAADPRSVPLEGNEGFSRKNYRFQPISRAKLTKFRGGCLGAKVFAVDQQNLSQADVMGVVAGDLAQEQPFHHGGQR
ncbi:hypothetical protein AWV80_17510 [Cupriavidus sp. UYMU48A]|nr:hypothetical protein AWV80_17510 [Cupriavidus sp. UYMU48A]